MLSNEFLILRRIQRDTTVNLYFLYFRTVHVVIFII